ncbi:MAG: energy-coupling factor transport system permease protein [Actinomycetota bacterium]|nr:energy-coupling factor transport system permease protein [Actinomycetota bacterium]
MTGWRLPRSLHPGAWWLWAIGLATAASRTTNPLLLGLVVAVAGYVVAARRTDAPWARAYGFYLRMGLVVLAIRVVFAALFGAPTPGHVLLQLPEVALPDWAAGVRLGGDVTLPAVVAALYDGLQLATMLACVGAANALASPKRLLQSLPGALYEVGVAVVVALSFSPQLVEAVTRVRAARRLRGRPDRGLRGLRGVAMPVLESALERSVELAAAMDARGFGRAGADRRGRRVTGLLTGGGLIGVCIGIYGLLDAGSPTALGLPMLLAGAALAVAGLAVGGRRATRSRYRPDPWDAPEWAVAVSGAAAAVAVLLASAGPGILALRPDPTTAPPLPALAALGVLVALLPAWLAPVPAPDGEAEESPGAGVPAHGSRATAA